MIILHIKYPVGRHGTCRNGGIRLSVSTVNSTYELSGVTHVIPFRIFGKTFDCAQYLQTDRESIPRCSPVSPFLRFVVTELSPTKSISTERCHVGHSREFVGTVCCTYGQSNATIVTRHKLATRGIWWVGSSENQCFSRKYGESLSGSRCRSHSMSFLALALLILFYHLWTLFELSKKLTCKTFPITNGTKLPKSLLSILLKHTHLYDTQGYHTINRL